MAEEKEKPLTREDVLKLIEQNGGITKGLDLSGKVFEKDIDLSSLNLSGIILKDTVFVYIINNQLVSAHLEKADLSYSHLEGDTLVDARLEGADLYDAHLEGADLMSAHFEGASLQYAHLEGADLMGAHLEGASLYGAKFSPDTKLEDADWGNSVLGEEKNGLFDWAVAAYRQLKVWYKNAGLSDMEGLFLYREMECKRKQFWWGHRNPRLKDLIHPFQPKKFLRAMFPRNPLWWVLLTAYYLLCGYGERPKMILAWIFVIVFGLAAAYYFWGSFDTSSFWDTLYYSVASFTALGYGKWAPQPTGWAKGIGAAEAFMGVFMMALFLVTFVRKMTR